MQVARTPRRMLAAVATVMILAASCSPASEEAAPSSGPLLTWTRSRIPCDSVDIGDLVATPEGFALTCPYGETELWISPDAISWTPATPPQTVDDGFRLRAVPAGLLAVAGTGAWHSVDGSTWSQVELGTAPLDGAMVAAGGAGALIIEAGSRRAWASADGTAFAPVGRVPQLDGTSSVFAFGSGFVIAALYVDPVPGAEWSTVLWVTEDARTWERVDGDVIDGTFKFGSADSQASLREYLDEAGAASSHDTHLVLSRKFGFGATPAYSRPRVWADAVWRSDDGVSWTDITEDPALAGGRFRQIAGGELGWLLVGQNWDAPVWWFSPDGETWEQAPQEVSSSGAPPNDHTNPPNRMLAAVGADSVVVAVDPFDGPPMLWVGEAAGA